MPKITCKNCQTNVEFEADQEPGWYPCPNCEQPFEITAPARVSTEIVSPSPRGPIEAIAKQISLSDNDPLRELIGDGQDYDVTSKIYHKITPILTRDERIQYIAVQKKPVVTISPDAIVLTNKRFIFAQPKLTGFKFEDFLWRDVHDVHLSEQMLGATISCTVVGGRSTEIDHLPKDQARQIYSVAQEREEEMIEERRARQMEEMRASAGGVVIQSPTTQSTASAQTEADPVEQLGKLKKMLEADLISAEEYDAKKAEILSRM